MQIQSILRPTNKNNQSRPHVNNLCDVLSRVHLLFQLQLFYFLKFKYIYTYFSMFLQNIVLPNILQNYINASNTGDIIYQIRCMLHYYYKTIKVRGLRQSSSVNYYMITKL